MKKETISTNKTTMISKEELINVIRSTYLDNSGESKLSKGYSKFYELVKSKSKPQFLVTRVNDGLEIKCFRIEWVEFDPETKRATAVHPHIALGRSLIADRMGSIHTWMTTEVTKVIQVAPNTIHFLTKNSEYKITKI